MVQVGKKFFLKEIIYFVFLFYRPYDRHLGVPPIIDPYYGSGLPQGPPSAVNPYNYDPYQKYYASRPRDPEFPGQGFVIIFYRFNKRKLSFFFLVIMISIQLIVMIHME